jgi:3-phosphoshikimate 1-carboxyvinyltransferase
MDLLVKPASKLNGEVKPQPSKLYTQFATALALISDGKSTIGPPLKVKDTLALLHAVEGMGATVKRSQERWSIWGVGRALKPIGSAFDAKNSATALSLMTSVASIIPRISVVTGDAQLRSRQMPLLLAAFRRLGIKVYSTKPDNSPPFVVFGDELKGGRISFGKAYNSQCLPPILLPCPYAKKRLNLTFPQSLKSYQLKMTIELMGKAGVKVKATNRSVEVPNQPYRAFEAEVPPDLVASAPLIAAAALTDSQLKLQYPTDAVGRDSIFLEILKNIGIKIQTSRKGFTISGPQRLRAASLDLSDAPEFLPIVAVLACKAKGKTTIKGAAEARNMKSDRISAMAHELRRMRVKVVERRDGLLITGPNEFKGGEVDGHDDHAVVASLVAAGLLASSEVRIKNRAEALQTSYSRFVSVFQAVGADIGYTI